MSQSQMLQILPPSPPLSRYFRPALSLIYFDKIVTSTEQRTVRLVLPISIIILSCLRGSGLWKLLNNKYFKTFNIKHNIALYMNIVSIRDMLYVSRPIIRSCHRSKAVRFLLFFNLNNFEHWHENIENSIQFEQI